MIKLIYSNSDDHFYGYTMWLIRNIKEHMKKLLNLICFLTIGLASFAQDPDAAQLHETAKQFMRGGDWANAVLVLNKALQKEPQSISIQKDLALTYYYQRDFAKARETVKPLVEREDADVPTYQIAGNIYKH